jgi:AmiR/NasT family two-component response regulator
MMTVLPVDNGEGTAPPLAADLTDAGLRSLPATRCHKLVRDALQLSPDLLVCWHTTADDALLPALEALAATAPLPVLVFTNDATVESMQRALSCGVHGWVVHGYARERLRPLAALTRERFQRERQLQEALSDLQVRFEERKRVDRAKGLLMRAAQVSEEEAFRRLRQASMHSQRRVGVVAQQLIDGARDAEAMNRAGQLRMLSQRVVKLAAVVAGEGASTADASLLQSSLDRAAANLDALSRSLSQPTYGDFVDALRDDWTALRAAVVGASLSVLDTQAEACLVRAERLVSALHAAGNASTLPLVNLCGRQRMLSQRVAKRALLGQKGSDGSSEAFEQALRQLREQIPAQADTDALLDSAEQAWRALLAAGARSIGGAERRELLANSEALLETFERLTERCERNLEELILAGAAR